MKKLKALRLLKSLNNSERQQLRNVIKKQNRHSLEKLLNIALSSLSKDQILPEKPDLFQKVFKSEYNSGKDYLLRNEIRLLTEKIHGLLEESSYTNELKNNPALQQYHLLKSYRERGLLSEYESLYYKSLKIAHEQYDFFNAHRINRDYFNYLMSCRELNADVFNETHRLLTEDIDNIKTWYRTQTALNQQGKVAMEDFLNSYGVRLKQTNIGPDKDIERISNNYIEFIEQVGNYHQASGNEKIAFAHKALKNILKLKVVYPLKVVDAYAILAGSYMLEGKWSKAAKYHKEGLDFASEKKLQVRLDVLFNYCSTLMKLRKYKIVIDLIKKYQKEIDKNQRVHFRFKGLLCFCHIFNNDYDGVLSEIPRQLGKRPESEYQYFRFIYCILPYMLKDYESGIRETDNFIRYFHRKGKEKLSFYNNIELAQIFKLFYQALIVSSDKKTLKTALQKCRDMLEAFNKANPVLADRLYNIWLANKLQA
ncbi:MAG: hypothetical protein WD048_16040 [Chitinophagales bacterium]